MYSDVLYCMECNKAFKDTWVLYDSRVDKVMLKCPHCGSINILNATKVVIDYENGDKFNKYLSCIPKELYEQMYLLVDEIGDKFKRLEREIIFYNNKVIKYVNDQRG